MEAACSLMFSKSSLAQSAQALSGAPFFHVLRIASVGPIFCKEIGSYHLFCILFTFITSNALLMPHALMPFDFFLKIRPLTCDPRPTVMVGPFLSENDE